MRSLMDEQRIKNLAQKFWEISGHQSNRSDEFYFLAEQTLLPYIGGKTAERKLVVYDCDCCTRKFTDYENSSNNGFYFCSGECEELGPR